MADPHLIATARFNRFLDCTPAPYHEGESVRLLVASRSPIGHNTVINHAHRGMLYHTEVQTTLQSGDWVKGYVRAIRPDGKQAFNQAIGALYRERRIVIEQNRIQLARTGESR